ncbi:MAG: hypothetical protein V2I76_14735, partial [Roseobacter sp.]|nr:hypothetical protein [Roseobacter sp.]
TIICLERLDEAHRGNRPVPDQMSKLSEKTTDLLAGATGPPGPVWVPWKSAVATAVPRASSIAKDVST